MAEPITTALIVGLAAGKFAEGAGGKAAEKLVEQLWGAIAGRFSGRKKTEENLAAIAASRDGGAMEKVATVLAAEFVEDEVFEAEVRGLAEQIVQIQSQSQMQQGNNNYGRDQIIINQPTGNLKIGG